MTFTASAPLRRALAVSVVAAGALLLSGCDRSATSGGAPKDSAPATEAKPSTDTTSAESKPSAAEAQAPVVPPEKVLDVVNPKRTPAYEGPTGRVAGRVTVTGDQPPEMREVLAQITGNCPGAREAFQHAYRQGAERRLADVLVAVTGYKGYLPARGEAITVEASGCAWSTRTVAVMYGQRLDIVSKDQNTYVPELFGQPWPVQLFATPGGAPVSLTPQKPGHYVLLDSMRLFNAADVYVLAYPTFDVTGLDGAFEIDGVPVGKVQVNALLPISGVTAEREVTVEAGQTATINLEIAFDRAAFDKSEAERARARAEHHKASEKAKAAAAQ